MEVVLVYCSNTHWRALVGFVTINKHAAGFQCFFSILYKRTHSQINMQPYDLHTYTICFQGSAHVPVRVAGDGMETEKPQSVLEVNTDKVPPGPSSVPLLKVASPKHGSKPPHPPLPIAPQPPGVLHLGKVNREACAEVEAVRIIVPRAAICRSNCAGRTESKAEAGQHVEEQGSPLLPVVEDWRGQLEKLQNSERRLLQDKEGLFNQLRVQTEVILH